MEKLLNVNSRLKGKKIHLIGIGGSGMYPLAQILHGNGYLLTGSDNNETDTVGAVREMGISVFMGHSPKNIAVSCCEVVVRSAAIGDDNPEIVAAREQNIEVMERAELLGLITAEYSKAVCVSGTHGKTTVSSMLTYIFLSAGTDISAVIGGKLGILSNGSGRTGTSDVMICEACEYSDTFLHLYPNISVILNIDEDHLEYFKTMENLRNSFTKFCNITSDVLVINGGDSNTATAVKNSDFSGTIVTFGFDCENDYFPRNIQNREFDLMFRGDFLKHIKLSVPGEHNVLNALAACATTHHCGIGESSIAKGLESFTGAGRRFEILAEKGGITVADDYAHHPAEIEATLKAAKTMDFKRIWAIHQPFTYSRTKSMLNEFAASLSIADKVTLTEIMGGRESDTLGVKTEDLVELVNCKEGCNKLADFGQIADYVADNSESGDLIITLGCGDVNKIAKKIVESLYFSS